LQTVLRTTSFEFDKVITAFPGREVFFGFHPV
jgi:hypothetical protein